jgi:hypothetical protein
MLRRLPAILVATVLGGTLSVVSLVILSREPPTRRLVGGRPLAYWVACLDSGDAALRTAAERNLPQFGPDAVDPLVERLDDDSTDVTLAASAVIATIGPAGVPPLTAALRKGGTPFRRIAIIRLLKAAGPAASAPANPVIAAQLADRDISAVVADYFTAYGPDPDAIAAAAVVLPIGSDAPRSDAEAILKTAWRHERWRGVVTDVMVKQARSGEDPRRRWAAWQELARWAPTSPASLQLFAEALDDPYSVNDARAALRSCDGRQVFLTLSRVAGNRQLREGQRLAALQAIGDQFDRLGLPSLIASPQELVALRDNLAADPSTSIRTAAANAVWQAARSHP